MNRYRIRIRFRKEDDLRLISHRDLVRAFERMFRRANLRLGMSEGFHPKPRMTFPSALSLGIRGADEVMEFELAEETPTDLLTELLERHAPPGLVITEVTALAEGQRKARAARFVYEFPVPSDRRADIQQSIDELLAAESRWITREKPPTTIDVRAGLESLEYCDDQVRFTLAADQPGIVRPREVLSALGLDDLESEGAYLTRARVELQT
ncbi:MAG: TIGR03936 family radical SAM-associated protein [Planctomycetales bacterium]|nr:TIGR03936 family radical SAM-associated protein [Planctomycetales bacterium]MCA9221273.1 TIGR03936 family radical SAM-associated protein [Planctomycetales bacterium]